MKEGRKVGLLGGWVVVEFFLFIFYLPFVLYSICTILSPLLSPPPPAAVCA